MEGIWFAFLCLLCVAICSRDALAEEWHPEGTELHSTKKSGGTN